MYYRYYNVYSKISQQSKEKRNRQLFTTEKHQAWHSSRGNSAIVPIRCWDKGRKDVGG